MMITPARVKLYYASSRCAAEVSFYAFESQEYRTRFIQEDAACRAACQRSEADVSSVSAKRNARAWLAASEGAPPLSRPSPQLQPWEVTRLIQRRIEEDTPWEVLGRERGVTAAALRNAVGDWDPTACSRDWRGRASPEQVAAAVEAVFQGATLDASCAEHGVGKEKLYRELRADPRFLDERPRARDTTILSPTRRTCLGLGLREGGVCASEVMREMGVVLQTARTRLSSLKLEGLLEARKPPPSKQGNRVETRYFITDAGRALLQEAAEAEAAARA